MRDPQSPPLIATTTVKAVTIAAAEVVGPTEATAPTTRVVVVEAPTEAVTRPLRVSPSAKPSREHICSRRATEMQTAAISSKRAILPPQMQFTRSAPTLIVAPTLTDPTEVGAEAAAISVEGHAEAKAATDITQIGVVAAIMVADPITDGKKQTLTTMLRRT